MKDYVVVTKILETNKTINEVVVSCITGNYCFMVLQLICSNHSIAMVYFHKRINQMCQKINESFAQINL